MQRKNPMLDPIWIKQTRRDGRILMAIFMGVFMLVPIVAIALVGLADFYFDESVEQSTYEWLGLFVTMPVLGYLLLEGFYFLDGIWVKRMQIEQGWIKG